MGLLVGANWVLSCSVISDLYVLNCRCAVSARTLPAVEVVCMCECIQLGMIINGVGFHI